MQKLKLLMIIPAALLTFGCSHMHYKGCGHDDPPAATSQQATSDSAITSAVQNRLAAKRYNNVQVATNDGVVTLSGTASSKHQIRHAMMIAKSVRGVRSVNSNITLANQ